MEQEKSNLSPEQIMEGVEKLDGIIESVMESVHQKERECLNAVFLRFCIKKGYSIDFSKISPVPMGMNCTKYLYAKGTPKEYFLMMATFSVSTEGPVLDVDFNPELAFNNEL